MTNVALSPTDDVATGARPLEAHERLTLLDALRGFALFGVFASNVNLWFSGRIFLPPARIEAMMASRPNAVAAYLFSFFIFGKFISIFAFLFGTGFAIQMMRAEARGSSGAAVYARRLGVMLLLGAVHLFALWYGDILSWYAALGFALLLFRKRSDRTLVFTGLALALLLPLLASTAEKFLPPLLGAGDSAAAAKAVMEKAAADRARALGGFEGSSYLTAMRANAAFFFDFFISRNTAMSFVPSVLGKFLLGLYAGRRRLLHEPEKHLRLFRWLLVIGLVTGVIGNGINVAVRYLFINKIIQGEPTWMFLMSLVREGGFLGLAMFYVSAITLLFQRPFWRRLFLVLAPVGQMALTNYLTQSVFSVALFYGFGFGLIGRVGPALCFAIAAGIFSVQGVVSHLWLGRFRFGPAEWLWRSMTYGKAQPMRLPEQRAAALPASA